MTMPSEDPRSAATMMNKIPEVTVYFWIIKVLATTVGETAADFLSVRLDLGLGFTSFVIGVAFVAALITQLRARKYSPPTYWITVVLISVVGTLVSDNLVDGLGISLIITSIAFSVILAVVFVLWYFTERTLSIYTIFTMRRELFYWAAILFTFAMGTSVGDLLAERLHLGYGQAVVVFAAMISVIALLYYILRMGALLSFWLAYILTRPLGASMGDWLAQPISAGGLGWGTVATSFSFLGAILILVVYLMFSGIDQLPVATANRAAPMRRVPPSRRISTND